MTKEIVVKSANIKKLKFPSSGPWGKILMQNGDKSATVIQVITADKRGKPESHDNLVDIFLVLEGKGSLFIGGKIAGKKAIGGGDWIGEKLVNAKKYNISAGDIIIIPKNTPHQHGPGLKKILVLKTR